MRPNTTEPAYPVGCDVKPNKADEYYYGAKQAATPTRVYPATVDDMRRRRDTLRSHQQAVATKIELLTQLIALFED